MRSEGVFAGSRLLTAVGSAQIKKSRLLTAVGSAQIKKSRLLTAVGSPRSRLLDLPTGPRLHGSTETPHRGRWAPSRAISSPLTAVPRGRDRISRPTASSGSVKSRLPGFRPHQACRNGPSSTTVGVKLGEALFQRCSSRSSSPGSIFRRARTVRISLRSCFRQVCLIRICRDLVSGKLEPSDFVEISFPANLSRPNLSRTASRQICLIRICRNLVSGKLEPSDFVENRFPASLPHPNSPRSRFRQT